MKTALPIPALPLPLLAPSTHYPVPDEAHCHFLWDTYSMPQHIRAHSRMVAEVAVALGKQAQDVGLDISLDALLAGGLLHDLGKAYCIKHGGHHAQLGAAWVMRHTYNAAIAQCVALHVHWPWELDLTHQHHLLPLFIVYADKRVMHDTLVSMQTRYADLDVRYGHTELARQHLESSLQQGLDIEAALAERLRIPLHECSLSSGRLVPRT